MFAATFYNNNHTTLSITAGKQQFHGITTTGLKRVNGGITSDVVNRIKIKKRAKDVITRGSAIAEGRASAAFYTSCYTGG